MASVLPAPLATSNYTQPGMGSTHIPTPEELAIIEGYSRKVDKFKLAKYCKYTPVKYHRGLWYQFKRGMASLMPDIAGKQFEWADGADRPKGDNLAPFRMKEYTARRWADPLRMGDIAKSEQDIPHDEINKSFALTRCMTRRTALAVDVLTDETQWDATHVAYPSELVSGAGTWESSLTDDRWIQRCIHAAINRIHLDTEGAVGWDEVNDMLLLMNPVTAGAIASSLEIRDFVKQQASAPQIIEGSMWTQADFMLPGKLHGITPLIESAVKNTANKNGTPSQSYVFPDGYAALMFRPGTVEGLAGSSAFSTMQILFVDGNELKVEERHDPWHKYTEYSIVDFFVPVLVAPVTGFLFKGLTDDTSST